MAWCKLEDTFVDEPKFRRLSRVLKIEYAQAAGHIACLWSWATRHAPDGNLVTLTADDIAHAAKWTRDPSEFVDAIASDDIGLLDGERDAYEIHGFMKRAESRKAAQRQRKKRKKDTVSRAEPEPVTTQSRDSHADGAEPVTRERRGEERRGDSLLPLAPAASSEPTPIGQVRSAWLAAYAARYPTARAYPWGARESGQAKNLLKSVPLAEVLELVPLYLAWPNSKAIRAGHPWGTGPDSFVLKHIELRADVANLGRRGEAATVDVVMRKAEKAASGEVSAKDEASDLAQALLALVARRGRTWSSTCRYDGHETAEAGVAAELGAQAAEVVRRSGGWDAFCRDWGTKQGDGTARAQLRDVCEAAQSTPARRPALRLSADRQDGQGTVTVKLEGPQNER